MHAIWEGLGLSRAVATGARRRRATGRTTESPAAGGRALVDGRAREVMGLELRGSYLFFMSSLCNFDPRDT